MLNIEKSITNINIDPKVKKELLYIVEKAKAKHYTSSSSGLVKNIAKSITDKYPNLLESSSVIPEILMQHNYKTIDFLINSQVFGIYCILTIVISIGLGGGCLVFFWSLNKSYLINRMYASLFIILAQLVYYRFLWKKLMP